MNMLSVVIITYNEARNLPNCLQAIEGLTNDIIVCDSYSTDDTVAIAESFGARVIQQAFLGYAAQKNFANTYTRHDWILSLDADEVLTPELKTEIANLKLNQVQATAFAFKRLANYCGHWVKGCGWYPDKKVRLFRKDQAQWVGDYVHETLALAPNTQVQVLQHDCLHYTMHNFEEHLQRTYKYSRLRASELAQKGKFANVFYFILKPPIKFIEGFVFKHGYLDGYIGLIICGMNAYFYFLVYAYLYLEHFQARHKNRHKKSLP